MDKDAHCNAIQAGDPVGLAILFGAGLLIVLIAIIYIIFIKE